LTNFKDYLLSTCAFYLMPSSLQVKGRAGLYYAREGRNFIKVYTLIKTNPGISKA